MYRALLFLAALLILEAAIIWRPFDTMAIAWQSSWDSKEIAGQMVDGFHLSQEVPAKLLAKPVPKKNITHWWRSHWKLHAHAPNCFAVRFATYNRQNSGKILVGYTQGRNSQTWKVDVSELRNDYHRFCPDAGLLNDQKLHIAIDGFSSNTGHAATAWLTHTPPLKPASINGHPAGNQSLNIRLVYFRHVGFRQILGIDGGAFLLACLISLMISAIALIAVLPPNGKPRASEKPAD